MALENLFLSNHALKGSEAEKLKWKRSRQFYIHKSGNTIYFVTTKTRIFVSTSTVLKTDLGISCTPKQAMACMLY